MTDTLGLMSIGEFSSRSRISVRMLRHYDARRWREAACARRWRSGSSSALRMSPSASRVGETGRVTFRFSTSSSSRSPSVLPSGLSRRALLGAGALAGLSACSADSDADRSSNDRDATPRAIQPRGTVRDGVAADADALATAVLERAEVVVVAASEEPGVLARAGSTAIALGVPLLVRSDSLAATLRSLRTQRVIALPDGQGLGLTDVEVSPGPRSADDLGVLTGRSATVRSTRAPGVARALGELEPAASAPVLLTVEGETAPSPSPSQDTLSALPGLPQAPSARVVAVASGSTSAALVATARALGAQLVTAPQGDPRATVAMKALRADASKPALALGSGVDAERFAARLATARRAPEIPGGGLLPVTGRLLVALYGHPQTEALGMLGEQGPDAAVERVTEKVKEYAALTDRPVAPAFEIIATVAGGSAGRDGQYSSRTAVSELEPWVKAAERGGVVSVLDLQPGRTDFVTQAKAYRSLLERPGVGLALDPEWRLKPDQKHLVQIGSVGIDEVNSVITWLADLVRDAGLPPKILILHQFRLGMIRERERLDVSRDELQIVVHVDGQGGQSAKQSTWAAIRQGLPSEVFLGWKNFVDEDQPMLTPAQTLEQVHPTPAFVSYQ